MRKRIVTTLALALLLTGIASLPWAAAQETNKEDEAQLKASDSYKVEITVNEIENGKKINSRSYSMRLRASALPRWSPQGRVRVGGEVPVAVETGKFNYYNTGWNIDCRLMPLGNGNVAIKSTWDYSSPNVISANQNTPNPFIRHMGSEVEAVVPLDKPTVLTEMDDVATTRRYVVEVKVTKINP
jgi:hypothetical protein